MNPEDKQPSTAKRPAMPGGTGTTRAAHREDHIRVDSASDRAEVLFHSISRLKDCDENLARLLCEIHKSESIETDSPMPAFQPNVQSMLNDGASVIDSITDSIHGKINTIRNIII